MADSAATARVLNKSHALRLLEVAASVPDEAVAKLIADKMIFYARSEWYRYQINHDIRPPKCLACPLHYDWTVKDKVGIDTTNKAHARKWLTDAALAGYSIEEVDGHHKPTPARTESIAEVRRRAEYHQRPKPENDDDDIPF